MPRYVFRCDPCGYDADVVMGITDDSVPYCDCGSQMLKVLQMPGIAAAALPVKGRSVTSKNNMEKGWHKDHAAYRRLRKEGIQPRTIDGSSEWESKATNKMEIETGGIVSAPENKVQEAREIAHLLKKGA